MRAPTHDEIPVDPGSQWAHWVSSLPETARRILTDPESDRETLYRELVVARKISFGAVLLELLTIEETSWRGAEGY